MVARPLPNAPTCRHCGCYLAADDHDCVCSPCKRAYSDKVAAGYRPQHDAALRTMVLCTLMEHEGEPVNLYQALGMWPAGMWEWIAVKCHVRYWRRHGHLISGRYHEYVYEGCSLDEA